MKMLFMLINSNEGRTDAEAETETAMERTERGTFAKSYSHNILNSKSFFASFIANADDASSAAPNLALANRKKNDRRQKHQDDAVGGQISVPGRGREHSKEGLVGY